MRAVESGNLELIKVLIQKGADVNVKDQQGNTALKLARKRKSKETIKVLENAGARPSGSE